MMRVQRPLLWHQGLFLQPQHLQQLDLSLRSLLSPFHEFMEPHFWGVGNLEIQKTAIDTRSFVVSRGAFLFPDGTYAVVPDNAIVEPRPFDEAWIDGGKTFPVYVGIKRWNEAGENVTVLSSLEKTGSVATRLVSTSDPEEIPDLHSGGPTGQVRKLHYMLKVFWDTERDQLGDYLLIPVAQLERVGAQIVLSSRFNPPCLTISGSEYIAKIVKEIRDQITARSHYLEEYKTQRGIQTAEFGSRDMVYLLALRSLNRYVPILFHFMEAQQVHPWTVYGVLRQLIGELSSFSEKVNVLGESTVGYRSLPAYDHSNLWDCFSTAQAIVSLLLDEITAGPEYVIRLLYDGTYFAAELEPAIFKGSNRFYLVFKTEEDPKSVLQMLGSVAKLSAREQLPKLIALALPAIGLEHLPVPPQELPRRARSIYCAVDHHSDQWATVERNHNIALYWDNAPDDLEVELMVVGRS
jgi:type VI secretion system protein ImpJ